MARSIKTHAPGQILIREASKDVWYIHYKPYKGEKRVSSGLIYNKKNIKVVEEILEHHYKKYLEAENKADFSHDTYLSDSIFQSFEYFKEHCRSKGVTNRTIYEYSNSFRTIIHRDYPPNQKIRMFENGRYVNVLTLENNIKEYLSVTEHSGNTINKNIRHIQVFVKFLIDREEIPDLNVYKKYKVDSVPKDIEPYTPEEAKMIINKAKETDEILYLFIMLLYLTGARITEWLKAYFNKDPYNVDLENGLITFRNKIKRNEYQTIPISDKLYEILNRLKELSDARVRYKGKVIPFSEKSQTNIIKKLNRIEIELGIKKPGRSTHGFRKLLATELFANEVPIDVIKDIMRHASIETTLKSYRKMDVKRIKDSLDRLNR